MIQPSYDWLRLGIYILDKWKSALKLKYPQYNSGLVLSFDEDDCVVRFHKKRENEVPWMILILSIIIMKELWFK